jgi:hypothetical protein
MKPLLAEQVRIRRQENEENLSLCSVPHEFQYSKEPENLRLGDWVCKKCQGRINNIQKTWYEKGIQHEKEDAKKRLILTLLEDLRKHEN